MTAIDDEYKRIVDQWGNSARSMNDDADALRETLRDFEVRFAYNSGRIENRAITYNDTREVFEKGTVTAYSGDLRTLFEIQNQKACHEFLLDAMAGKKALDEELLLHVHEILTHGTYDERRWRRGERPGTYKNGDYVVGAADSGLPASDVPRVVAELLDEIKVADEHNVLTVAAYFHVVLESIHPFADGNGRAGRALTNYLLMSCNHPPVIFFDEDKLAYYGAIQAWDLSAELEPMKEFMRVEAIKTWDPSTR